MMVSGMATLMLAAAATASGPMPVGRAIEAAEAATGARAFDADTDTDRQGRLVWEIELSDGKRGYEVHVDAVTGAILKNKSSRTARIDAGSDAREAWAVVKDGPSLGPILDQLESETGGRVLDAQFDTEAGQARYEVEISTRAGVTDIYLDPRTGERLISVYED